VCREDDIDVDVGVRAVEVVLDAVGLGTVCGVGVLVPGEEKRSMLRRRESPPLLEGSVAPFTLAETGEEVDKASSRAGTSDEEAVEVE
jgi:hypothetical protein